MIRNRMRSKEVLALNTSINTRNVCDHVVRELSVKRLWRQYMTYPLDPEGAMGGKHRRNANGTNGHLLRMASVDTIGVVEIWRLREGWKVKGEPSVGGPGIGRG